MIPLSPAEYCQIVKGQSPIHEIVSYDSYSNSMTLVASGIDYLKSFQVPLQIISLIGREFTGKTIIAREWIEGIQWKIPKYDDFDMKRLNPGLYAVLVDVESDDKVVLVDAEGTPLNSPQTDDEEELECPELPPYHPNQSKNTLLLFAAGMKKNHPLEFNFLMGLCFFLSDVCVLNGTFYPNYQEKDLSDLVSIVNGWINVEQVSFPFPHLVYCIRDVPVLHPINGNDYLNEILESKHATKNRKLESEQIRRVMQLFPSVRGYAVFAPLHHQPNVALLQQMSGGFQKNLEETRAIVRDVLKVHQQQPKPDTFAWGRLGYFVATLISNAIKSLVTEQKIPSLVTLKANAEKEFVSMEKDLCVRKYHQVMNSHLYPMEHKALVRLHKQAWTQVIALLEQEAKFFPKTIKNEIHACLQTLIGEMPTELQILKWYHGDIVQPSDSLSLEYERKNVLSSKRKSEIISFRIFGKCVKPIRQYDSVEAFGKDLVAFQKLYEEEKSLGPCQELVLQDFLGRQKKQIEILRVYLKTSLKEKQVQEYQSYKKSKREYFFSKIQDNIDKSLHTFHEVHVQGEKERKEEERKVGIVVVTRFIPNIEGDEFKVFSDHKSCFQWIANGYTRGYNLDKIHVYKKQILCVIRKYSVPIMKEKIVMVETHELRSTIHGVWAEGFKTLHACTFHPELNQWIVVVRMVSDPKLPRSCHLIVESDIEIVKERIGRYCERGYTLTFLTNDDLVWVGYLINFPGIKFDGILLTGTRDYLLQKVKKYISQKYYVRVFAGSLAGDWILFGQKLHDSIAAENVERQQYLQSFEKKKSMLLKQEKNIHPSILDRTLELGEGLKKKQKGAMLTRQWITPLIDVKDVVKFVNHQARDIQQLVEVMGIGLV